MDDRVAVILGEERGFNFSGAKERLSSEGFFSNLENGGLDCMSSHGWR